MFPPGQIGAIPPAASQCLKQCRRIGETIGLRLQAIDPRLLIGLFGIQHREIVGVAVLQLALGQIERHPGGVFGRRGRLECERILLECGQRVGDILEGSLHRAAILLECLHIGVPCRVFLVHECPAVENGRGQLRADLPEAHAGRKGLADHQSRAAGIGGQLEIGQAVCHRHAELCACGVEVLFGLQHIGPLRDKLRRKAHRNVLRQRQTREFEFVCRRLVGKPADQYGERIALLRQLLDQRG